MKMEHGEMWPGYDYHLTITCHIKGNHQRRVVQEVHYILVGVKIAFKYMDV